MKHLIPYVSGSSFGDDNTRNSRANFLHPGWNDAVEKALEFIEKWEDRRKG